MNQKANFAIAVDIGASNSRAAIISKQGKIVKYIKNKTPKRGKSGKVISDNIIRLIKEILQDFSKNNLKAIGISSIGPLSKKGEILQSPNIPFKKVPVKASLEKYFSLPVSVYNDCAAAAWGEKIFGAGKKYKNIVYITISSGIGGGAIVDNHLLIGRNRNAAEIGHFNIDTKYNFPCSCGKGKGHWEACCSGENLPLFLKYWLKFNKIKMDIPNKKTQPILDLANKGKNKHLAKFIKEISKINGKGVSNVIAAYDPELITIGGGMALNPNNKKIIISGMKKNIDGFLEQPKIIITPLKDSVTLYGAAALVFYPPK